MRPPAAVILYTAVFSSVQIRAKIVDKFLDVADYATFYCFESRLREHLVLNASFEAMHTFVDCTDRVWRVLTGTH